MNERAARGTARIKRRYTGFNLTLEKFIWKHLIGSAGLESETHVWQAGQSGVLPKGYAPFSSTAQWEIQLFIRVPIQFRIRC